MYNCLVFNFYCLIFISNGKHWHSQTPRPLHTLYTEGSNNLQQAVRHRPTMELVMPHLFDPYKKQKCKEGELPDMVCVWFVTDLVMK